MAELNVTETQVRKQRGPFAEVMHRLSKSPLAMFGLGFILLLVFCAVFANWLAPYPFAKQNLLHMFELPSAQYWLGTDEFGRDILSRLIFGARVSLQVGFIAVGISLVVGGLLGAFFAAAGALAAGLAVEQDFDIKFLVVIGAGLADELVAQDLILLALHQLLQGGLVVKIMRLSGRDIAEDQAVDDLLRKSRRPYSLPR